MDLLRPQQLREVAIPTDTSSFFLSPLAGERDLCFMYLRIAYGGGGPDVFFLAGAAEEKDEE